MVNIVFIWLYPPSIGRYLGSRLLIGEDIIWGVYTPPPPPYELFWFLTVIKIILGDFNWNFSDESKLVSFAPQWEVCTFYKSRRLYTLYRIETSEFSFWRRQVSTVSFLPKPLGRNGNFGSDCLGGMDYFFCLGRKVFG